MLSGCGLAGVDQRGPVDHASYLRFRGGGLAKTTRSRRRVEDAARQVRSAQTTLRIADRFSFGMRRGIGSVHDPARAFADDSSIGNQYRAVRLIAPGLGQALHRNGGLEPALLRLERPVGARCRER